MSAGWALSLNTSPFSASVLIVARLTALPVTRIAHRWHGPYALGAWAAAALYLALLAAWPGQADGPPPPPRAAPPAEAIIP